MIQAVMENLIGGYLHPRASVRRLLAGRHGIDAAVAMVVLAWVVREMFFILVPGGRQGGEGVSFVYYLVGLIDSLITFGLFSLMVCYVGHMFGGKANFPDTALVVAWYLLVTSIIVPLILPAVISIVEAARAGTEVPGGPGFVVMASSAVMLWLLASYIAELHRFARTWQVLGALLGFSILFSFVFSGLMSGV
ncbi:MAG TPA: hypothetical protein VMM59_10630 [Thermohalobaculum sp.]|nr:hypothetical protein [Thermohalobaculum sp.]